MITALFEAFVLGLVAGAVPGPILTSTFAEILAFGFVRGVRFIFMALIAETVGALLIILVLYQLGLSILVIKIISICGAIVLFWLATQVWKINQVDSSSKDILSFPKIIILTILNSSYWIFWITVGVPKAFIINQFVVGGRFIYLALFEVAWLTMTTLLAFIFFKFRPLLLRKNLINVTFKILSTILVLLSIKTLIGAF